MSIYFLRFYELHTLGRCRENNIHHSLSVLFLIEMFLYRNKSKKLPLLGIEISIGIGFVIDDTSTLCLIE